MSGGTFEHRNHLLHEWAGQIKHVIEMNDSKEKDQWGYPRGRGYSAETIERLRVVANYCLIVGDLLHHVDYLLADDYGEGSFWKATDKPLEEIRK